MDLIIHQPNTPSEDALKQFLKHTCRNLLLCLLGASCHAEAVGSQSIDWLDRSHVRVHTAPTCGHFEHDNGLLFADAIIVLDR